MIDVLRDAKNPNLTRIAWLICRQIEKKKQIAIMN